MLFRISITMAGVILTLVLSVAFALAQSNRSTPRQFTGDASHPRQEFQDPQGRYSFSVPAGWELSHTGGEPVFHNGPSWIQVRELNANSASDAVDDATALFRSQFTAFNTINRGNTTIAGRASHGLNVDGTTVNGQRMSVLFTAQPEGRKRYFVLVSATPQAQAAQLNTSVMAVANSVRFSGE